MYYFELKCSNDQTINDISGLNNLNLQIVHRAYKSRNFGPISDNNNIFFYFFKKHFHRLHRSFQQCQKCFIKTYFFTFLRAKQIQSYIYVGQNILSYIRLQSYSITITADFQIPFDQFNLSNTASKTFAQKYQVFFLISYLIVILSFTFNIHHIRI